MNIGKNQDIVPNTREIIHGLPIPEVYAALATRSQGLTKAEAETRHKDYGPNAVEEIKGKPLILKFLSNFTHLMAMLLWVGGLVGFIAQLPELGIAIWLVNIINGVFSFMQEYRAEKATEMLRKMLPLHAHVLREGEEQNIPAEELVPGDIILLCEGDRISADARLVEDNDLSVDQSTLTGESNPVRKTKDVILQTETAVAEQNNLLFAGTNVVVGTGKAVVFATGMKSEFGKIAGLTEKQKEAASPLQKELERLTRTISIMVISIGVIFFAAAVLIANADIAKSFIFAMGMIVAFVPEGLLPTVTLSLAMGVQRMAKRNALIKRLSSVETLGCTTVICTDKTGTLTRNEMTVNEIWMVDQQLKVTGVGYAPEGQILIDNQPCTLENNRPLRELLSAAALCNNARLVPPGATSPHWTILGDPTEAALQAAAQKGGLDLAAEAQRYPRLRELPFDSRRKRMSTIHYVNNPASNKAQIAFVKGAPKEVLSFCTHVLRGGQEQLLNENLCRQIMAANDEYAGRGLRVLAVARRWLTHEAILPDNPEAYTAEIIEKDLTFLGLIAISDPPRIEAAAAIEKCHNSGIRIIMMTGDYGLTAESIARQIGIIRGERPRILTDTDLEQIDPEAFKEVLRDEVIFARVAPERKLQVVEALQEMGHVVAVTGDGVNDSPALKKADIGVAMGIAGTDVAKEAADMILTDDNFASIVNAVEEGRAVYENIRKFAIYVFNSNMAEAVPFILYLFSRGRIPLPLTIMQVLSIDLGTDMVPAIGLGAEHPESGIMNKPPRSQQERLLTRNLIMRAFFWYGLIESVAAISAYFYLNWLNGWPSVRLADGDTVYRMATTMTFAAIVVSQIGAVFGCRTERTSIFKIGFFTNKIILLGIVVELVLLCLLIYTPFLHVYFNTAPLGWREWAFLAIWAPLLFLADAQRKKFLRKRER
jgi:magnesium-transporting ATPase (P-type)